MRAISIAASLDHMKDFQVKSRAPYHIWYQYRKHVKMRRLSLAEAENVVRSRTFHGSNDRAVRERLVFLIGISLDYKDGKLKIFLNY